MSEILYKITEKVLEHYLKELYADVQQRREIIKAIKKAYNLLLHKAEEFNIDPELFRYHIDETLFKKPESVRELLVFLDPAENQNQPDVKKLYSIYLNTFTSGEIPKDTFIDVFDYFWEFLRIEIRRLETLKQRDVERILYQMDGYVSPQEIKSYINQYCDKMFLQCEEDFTKGLCYTDEYCEKYKYVIPIIEWSKTKFIAEPKPISIKDEIRSLENTRVAFMGNAGVGKTTFMLWLEKELLKEGKLALYFRASEITSDTDKHLTEKITTKLKEVFGEEIPEPKMKGFVRELKRDEKIIFIIDAFDQIANENYDVVNTAIKNINSNCPVFISTRPYSLERLEGYHDTYYVAEMKEFEERQLKDYFGLDDYEKASHLTSRAEGLINIPLLARFTKYLMLSGVSADVNNKAELFERIITKLIEKEIENIRRARKRVSKHKYKDMESMLAEISLKSLRKGHKGYFLEEEVRGHSEYLDLFEETQFIKHIVDYEGFFETEHYYQHPNFQEYYGSLQLFRLYREGNIDELFKSLSNIQYAPEVGLFFSELITLKSKNPEKDFGFWQEALFKTEDDWVRTYALQVRDKLCEFKAKESLEKLLDDENKKLICKELSDNMIRIPRGEFLRGSYVDSDEWPVRWIELDEYEIDRCPVTNEDFIEFLREYSQNNENLKDREGHDLINLTYSEIKHDGQGNFEIEERYRRHPVRGVIWYGAKEYCRWKGENYRPPTEAEWEKAARGIHGRRYPWGNEFNEDKCNSNESGISDTTEVGSYDEGSSPYGCLDMAGNVWDWCEDNYKSDYYAKSPDKNPKYSVKEVKDSVLRGGSWYYVSFNCRCANRGGPYPDLRADLVGFRCARAFKL